MDLETVPGAVQLARRYFADSTPITPVEQLAARQDAPDIAAGSDGALYAVWEDNRRGNKDIFFTRSTDGGATWSANTRVDDDIDTAEQEEPAIAIDKDGTIYVTWTDERNDAGGDLYFVRSNDGGADWSANVRVNDDTGAAGEDDPVIVVGKNGSIYIAWTEGRGADIYFDRSTDAGVTWGTDVRVNDAPGATLQDSPALAVGESGNIYAVWRDAGQWHAGVGWDNDIYFSRSTDGGAAWSADARVHQASVAWQAHPALAVGGNGGIYAAWVENIPDFGDVHLAYSIDKGMTWNANIRINESGNMASQGSPALTLGESGVVYAAWEDDRYADHVRATHGIPPVYFAKGVYTSPTLDTGVNGAAWERMDVDATIPSDAAIVAQTRSCSAGGPWSAWNAIEAGDVVSPPGQIFQYRLNLVASGNDVTPVLDRIGVVYRSSATPSAPRFITPCGITNRDTPTIEGMAAAGSKVHLYVDGTEAATATTPANGVFTFSLTLDAGSHTITAAAEDANGLGPVSSTLPLTVDPTLPYDPLNVRVGQWSREGWQRSVPWDANGCADPGNHWRVWPRRDERFYVEVPVSYVTSATVKVTLGAQSLALAEASSGIFTGEFTPHGPNRYNHYCKRSFDTFWYP